MKRNYKYLILICILLVVTLAVLFVKKYSNDQNITFVRTITFNTGKKTVDLTLNKRLEQGESEYFLRYKINYFRSSDLVLEGFEDEILPCNFKEINIDKQDNGLCLTGLVGAHSQNIQIIHLLKDKLYPVDFVSDNDRSPNIYSDLPEIKVKNENNITVIDLKNRDYDNNPLIDYNEIRYYIKKDGLNAGHYYFES